MPDRLRVSLDAIAEWHWLCHCAALAARGKRQRPAVQQYFNNFEHSTAVVAQALRAGELPVGSFRSFAIRDPKPRTIHAAPFADRVAHHALIGQLAPRFEKSQVDSSYACRSGKGSHAAILAAQNIAARSPWLLKMDVHSYFARIDHVILLGLLKRLFKGAELHHLLANVVAGFSTEPGLGLPIGALTSQYFANHYLDGFQRALRVQPGVIAELRYMDDQWVGCRSRAAARETAAFATDWLQHHRHLKLKPVWIQRSAIGLPFCGFRVSSDRLRLGRRRMRAIRRHYEKIGHQFEMGKLSELKAQQRLCSVTSLASPGCHASAMKKIIESSGINQICC